MNAPTRVFIVEQDAPSLVMLTLFLDQFEDIEVVGTAVASKFAGDIRKIDPEVVVYNWPSSLAKLPCLVRYCRKQDAPPALVCIRDGNFLPLEGTVDKHPEAQLPSVTTTDKLLETIRRSAVELRKSREAASLPITMPLPIAV
jgi:hypothetical protein